VVGNVKHARLDAELKPEMYLPLFLHGSYSTLLVRTAADPLSMVSAVRSQVQAIDREVPVFNVSTADQILAESLARRQFNMLLLGSFATVALLLAAVGIYGVMSYAVTQRTHEIGIRMALGAQAREVLWLVVRQGMSLTLIGVAAGLVAAFALTRVLKNLLFSVSTTDPATFAGIALLLVGVAFIASYLPARRATKVDPLTALRHE